MNEELLDEQAVETPPEADVTQLPETPGLVGLPFAPTDGEPAVAPATGVVNTPVEGDTLAIGDAPVSGTTAPVDDWVSVRWTMPLYGDTPIEVAGKWWHPGTEHTLLRSEAVLLGPEFAIIGPADAPPKGG